MSTQYEKSFIKITQEKVSIYHRDKEQYNGFMYACLMQNELIIEILI